MKRIIDWETYPRKTHFEYFHSLAYPYMGITANVEVTKLLEYARQRGGSGFLACLWTAAKAANGVPELRQAIAEHLAAFRGLHVNPENILIGAGTDFLYNLLIQLLGRDRCYAVEEPGYGKIRRIYDAGGVRAMSAPMDENGVRPDGRVTYQRVMMAFPKNIKGKLPAVVVPFYYYYHFVAYTIVDTLNIVNEHLHLDC